MKFKVTPELATLIRTIRMQNGISAKDVAEDIGRSPSFVTKLEKGDVRTIRKEELTEILSFIAEGDDFYSDKFPNILRTLSSIVSPDNMLKQGWLIQYDSYERPIEVPEEFCRRIALMMRSARVNAAELSGIINANKDLKDKDKLNPNEIVIVDYPKGQVLRLRAEVSEEQIRKITSCTDRITSYGTIYSIVFILVKLDKFGDIGFMEPPQAKEVLMETARILAYYNITSLTKYGQVLASNEFQSEQQFILSTFDTFNSDTINGIFTIIRDMGNVDRMLAMESADGFLANLEWDSAFMMRLIGMRFDQMGDLSYTNKKQFLDELTLLMDKYATMPEAEKKLNRY